MVRIYIIILHSIIDLEFIFLITYLITCSLNNFWNNFQIFKYLLEFLIEFLFLIKLKLFIYL
jgi:hypothetical protein